MEVEKGKEGQVWEGRAEACLSLTPGTSISICYHSQFGPHDDLLILEVDDKLLPDVLQNRVSIRGQPNEDAVLCTHSSTYAMKFVGTSNSVFLIPPGDSTPTMKATSANSDMSREKPYNLEEDFDGSPGHKEGLYRWQDLVEMIQASEEEVRAALKSLCAVEIDGHWRTVDDKTMNETLDMILCNSVLHDWQISALSEECVLSAMEADGFPPRIVSHCLETHGTKLYGSNDTLWRLDEKQVCLRFALRVLSRGKMKLESFMEKWEQSVPSGMKANLKMLEGEVLYDKIGVEEWIRVFGVSTLPSNPADRFAALFRERPKWEWKELEPYIRDIHVPGLSSEGLLIKYTRRTQPNADADLIFSSR